MVKKKEKPEKLLNHSPQRGHNKPHLKPIKFSVTAICFDVCDYTF